jgi:polyisoprenoid-binding protein YceI
MKTHVYVRLLLLPALIAAFMVSTIKCSDDCDEIVLPEYEYGTDIMDGDGFFDKTHSNIQWESEYQGVGAGLTGRFNSFAMNIYFDEDNPANTELEGWVDLRTVNTGEPGRDGSYESPTNWENGCLQGTFGSQQFIEDSLDVNGNPVPEPSFIDSLAWFTSTSVVKDNVFGYTVTGNFSFHGVTQPITGTLVYHGMSDLFPSTRGCGDYYLYGFTMTFDFMAKSVYGISSNNISDRMNVVCNAQFKICP